MLRVPALQIFEQSSSVVGEAKQIVTGFQQVEGKQLIFLFIVIILQFSHSLQMSLNGSTLTDSESTLIGSSSLTGSESTLTGSNSSLNGSGIIFLIAFTGYDTYSLQGTNFIIYSSIGSTSNNERML